MDDTKIDIMDVLERWVKADWWVILVAIMCLLACMYTISSVSKYQEAINTAWREQWDNSGCAVRYNEPNITYNWRGEYETEDRDNHTERTGVGNI